MYLDIGLWQMPNVFLPDFVMSAAILPEELLRKLGRFQLQNAEVLIHLSCQFRYPCKIRLT